MTGDLPVSRRAANRRLMRNRAIQFLLLIVALLACPDTPVMAYDAAPIGIDAHQHVFAEVAEDAAPDDSSPTSGGAELVHHHHCPAGLAVDASDANGSWLPNRDIHLARTAAALASRATAPPTEPPAA